MLVVVLVVVVEGGAEEGAGKEEVGAVVPVAEAEAFRRSRVKERMVKRLVWVVWAEGKRCL